MEKPEKGIGKSRWKHLGGNMTNSDRIRSMTDEELAEWNYDWADVPSEDIELLGFCPFNKAMIPQEFMLKDFQFGE